ncbi:MAG: hypothetical protein HQ481_09340 [Alphaproteobacteria bacterium]|nr:hypothetical protein [Alphaproteobacteria bacterium]
MSESKIHASPFIELNHRPRFTQVKPGISFEALAKRFYVFAGTAKGSIKPTAAILQETNPHYSTLQSALITIFLPDIPGVQFQEEQQDDGPPPLAVVYVFPDAEEAPPDPTIPKNPRWDPNSEEELPDSVTEFTAPTFATGTDPSTAQPCTHRISKVLRLNGWQEQEGVILRHEVFVRFEGTSPAAGGAIPTPSIARFCVYLATVTEVKRWRLAQPFWRHEVICPWGTSVRYSDMTYRPDGQPGWQQEDSLELRTELRLLECFSYLYGRNPQSALDFARDWAAKNDGVERGTDQLDSPL